MARRRSLNRRWSRKSGNLTELNQDSELFDDTSNDMWWKNLPDSTVHRPPSRNSYTQSTILSASSIDYGTELQDHWWDNLERTSLQSSKRYSTRKSLNPEEAVQESLISEDDEDVSIKKRKVLLRARQKRSGGTETFLKALEDSDVAQSEPLPSKKRKITSPTASDGELLQSKTRSRSTPSLVNGEINDNSENTSTDTDIIVKARPKAFSKRATKISANVYDEILTKSGPSEINSSKNASKNSIYSTANRSLRSQASHIVNSPKNIVNTPVRDIDSNESGFMGPPITGSHRKRLSIVSKTLNMTSSESEADAKPSKTRPIFQQRSKKNDSFNPFDEILSGHNESSSSAGTPSKSKRSANIVTRISKGLNQNQSYEDSAKIHEQKEVAEVSASGSKSRDAIQTNNEDINDKEEMLGIQDKNNSLLFASRVSISQRITKNTTIEEMASSQFIIPDTQNDRMQSISRAKNSMMIEESIDINEPLPVLDDNQRSSLTQKIKTKASQRLTRNAAIDDVSEEIEDVHEFVNKNSRATSITKGNYLQRRTVSNDHNSQLLNSGTDKLQSQLFEDWGSSGTEEDDDKKQNNQSSVSNQSSASKKLLQVSINRLSSAEISHNKPIRQSKIAADDDEEENLHKLRKIRSRSLRSHNQTREDSAYELPNKERSPSPIISASENESIKNALDNTLGEKSLINRNKSNRYTHETVNTLRKSDGTLGDVLSRAESGENSSEEESPEALKISDKSKLNDSVHDKTTPRKSIANPKAPKEQNSVQSINEEFEIGSLGLNLNRSKRSTRVQRKNDNPEASESGQFDKSVNKKINHRSKKSELNLSIKESKVENNLDSRKSALSTNVTHENDKFVESISDAETEIFEKETSEPLKENFLMKNRKNTSGTSSSRSNASRKRIDSDEIDSEDESNLKSTNQSKNVSRVSGKHSTHVSRNRINSDESNSEEESNLKSMNQSKNKSGSSRKRSAQVSRQHMESDEDDTEEDSENRENSQEESNLKSTNQSNNESIVSGKNSTHVSRNRINSDESNSEEESNLELMNQSKNKNGSSRKRSAQVSRQHMESDEDDTEEDSENRENSQEESNLNLANQSKTDESGSSRKRSAQVSRQHMESDKNDTEEDSENCENANPLLSRNTTELTANASKSQNATNLQHKSFSTVEDTSASITIPSEEIPLTPALTKLPKNTSLDMASKTQKNITDFFPSTFLQRNDNSKTLGSLSKFDKEKLDLVKKEVERKRQLLLAMKVKETAKAKISSVGQRSENTMNANKFRQKGNAVKATPKLPKVVDKAYIVNGQVYKRPKLPRPKHWVTNRLYAHLWKQMKPKYDLRTRVKSENFVQQLSEVVTLTIRRKKYDNYKNEVDALMKEMARLNIIITRNDFYHFCYDYLPYEFRVKVVPMLLPGCVENIPYDPSKLNTPILPDS